MLAFEFTTIPFRWERGVTHVCLRLVCCCVSLRSPSIGKWSVRRISGQKKGGRRNKKETKKKKKKTTTEKRKGKSNLSTSEGRHLWLRDWREDRETERAERVYVCSAVERSGGVYPKKKGEKKVRIAGGNERDGNDGAPIGHKFDPTNVDLLRCRRQRWRWRQEPWRNQFRMDGSLAPRDVWSPVQHSASNILRRRRTTSPNLSLTHFSPFTPFPARRGNFRSVSCDVERWRNEWERKKKKGAIYLFTFVVGR